MEYLSALRQRWEKLDKSWRFAITAFLVTRLFFAVWSWVVLTVQPVAVHYITEENKPVAIFLSLQTNQAHAYFRTVSGKILSFRSASEDTVIDLQTNSSWDIAKGIAMEGQLKGTILAPTQIPPDMFPYHGARPYRNSWLALWQRFDVNWYTTIAENGYGTIPGDDHYPPLYPLLIRLVSYIFGNAFISGLIVSHAATLYALKLLFDLFSQWEMSTGRRAIFYLLIYPASFFLFSAYTESLFLVTALLSLQTMQRRSWLWAGFWVFCAISIRLQGVALFAPMIYLMWKEGYWLQKISHWVGMVYAGVGFIFYLFLRSTQAPNSTIPFSEPAWHAKLVPPWQTYMYAVQTLLSGNFNYIDFINWLVATLFMLLIIIGWKKIPLEYSLYMTLNMIIILTRIVETKPLISMSRYALTLFPAFFVIASIDKNPWARRIIIYTCITLTLYLSAEFFGWGWVA